MIKFSAIIISILCHGVAAGVFFFSLGPNDNADFSLGGKKQLGTSLQQVQMQLFSEEQAQQPTPSEPDAQQLATEELVVEPIAVLEPLLASVSPLKKNTKKTTEKFNEKPKEKPVQKKLLPKAKEQTEDIAKPEGSSEEGISTPNATENLQASAATLAGDGRQATEGLAHTGGSNTNAWQAYKRKIFKAINAQQEYPKQARLRRLEGTVLMSFVVEKDGSVATFDILTRAKAKMFNRSAAKLFRRLALPPPPNEVKKHLPAELFIPLEYAMY